MSPCTRHSLTKALTAFLVGLNNFTGYERFLYMRAQNAHHNLYPHSLGGPARMDNTELVSMLETILPGLSDLKAKLDEDFPLIVDESQCSVLFRYTIEGQLDSGLYEQEAFHLIQFTEDSKEIQESWEMVDPTQI